MNIASRPQIFVIRPATTSRSFSPTTYPANFPAPSAGKPVVSAQPTLPIKDQSLPSHIGSQPGMPVDASAATIASPSTPTTQVEPERSASVVHFSTSTTPIVSPVIASTGLTSKLNAPLKSYIVNGSTPPASFISTVGASVFHTSTTDAPTSIPEVNALTPNSAVEFTGSACQLEGSCSKRILTFWAVVVPAAIIWL